MIIDLFHKKIKKPNISKKNLQLPIFQMCSSQNFATSYYENQISISIQNSGSNIPISYYIDQSLIQPPLEPSFQEQIQNQIQLGIKTFFNKEMKTIYHHTKSILAKDLKQMIS